MRQKQKLSTQHTWYDAAGSARDLHRKAHALCLEPVWHIEACVQLRPHIRTGSQGLQQRQHRLPKQPVIAVAPEVEHGNAVVRLPAERQRSVVHEHCSSQVPSEEGEVLDARV